MFRDVNTPSVQCRSTHARWVSVTRIEKGRHLSRGDCECWEYHSLLLDGWWTAAEPATLGWNQQTLSNAPQPWIERKCDGAKHSSMEVWKMVCSLVIKQNPVWTLSVFLWHQNRMPKMHGSGTFVFSRARGPALHWQRTMTRSLTYTFLQLCLLCGYHTCIPEKTGKSIDLSWISLTKFLRMAKPLDLSAVTDYRVRWKAF